MSLPDACRGRLPVVVLAATLLVGCAQGPPGSAEPTAPELSPPVASASAATRPRPTIEPPTQAEINRLLAIVSVDANDAEAQRDLGFALLQRVRETADPSLYDSAEAAFEAARQHAPDDALVLVGIGGLHLARHEFAEALEMGREAAALSPSLASARAVIVDALVELGRYDEADAEAAEMLALGSDLTTLSRVSYLAELRGDLGRALGAMQLAARTPGLPAENLAFVQSLLGTLLRYDGQPEAAAAAYDEALDLVEAHAPSLAGRARLAIGRGDLDEAIGLLERASEIVPLPEYVIALGDVQEAAGRTADAERSYALARAELQLFEASGVVVDLDLALFEADHGDAMRALELAMAAYEAAPTIRAADAVAWALHRLGRSEDALPYAQEAVRLGSRDPLLRFHAGAIEAALGDAVSARRDLQLALGTDPGFSATGAAEAARLLDDLPD